MLESIATKTTIDEATHTIRFERALTAPREKVFEAWTRAEHVTHWWDPSGAKLRACTIDLRPGGAFTFTNDGHSPPFSGTYQVIEPPHRLVFEAMGAVGTVLIEADGTGSRLTVLIRCASAEHLAQFVKFGVADGTARTLDNLGRYLG
jgi:uncharacterized protein YndB with AHSA1/START domain